MHPEVTFLGGLQAPAYRGVATCHFAFYRFAVVRFDRFRGGFVDQTGRLVIMVVAQVGADYNECGCIVPKRFQYIADLPGRTVAKLQGYNFKVPEECLQKR